MNGMLKMNARKANAYIKKWILGAALAAVLGIAFMGYLRPAFVIDLANRIFLCF
jgi:hypothetical protein